MAEKDPVEAARRTEELLAAAEQRAFDAHRKTRELKAVEPRCAAATDDLLPNGGVSFLQRVDRELFGVGNNDRTEVKPVDKNEARKLSTSELERISTNPNFSREEREAARKELLESYSRGST